MPGFVGVGLWRQFGAFFVDLRDIIIDLLVQGHNGRDGPHGNVGVSQETPEPELAGIRMALLQVLHLNHEGQPDLPRWGFGRTTLGEQAGIMLRCKPLDPGINGRTGDVQEPTKADFLPAWGGELEHVPARLVAVWLGVVIP
jgi:hypothetical protein